MSFFENIFNWGANQTSSAELPDLWPLPLAQLEFIRIDVIQTYSKILTDTLERTVGVPDKLYPLFWDNCLLTESGDGLVTRLAKAMEAKRDLFLYYDEATQVVREATPEEKQLAEDAFKNGKTLKSKVVPVSFSKYIRTDMVKLYSALEHCTVRGLYKSSNLSTAVQYKINDLRASVSLVDQDKAKEQAKVIANSLKKGKDVYLDAKDEIALLEPALDAVKASMQLLNEKRCWYLNLPLCYIAGDSGSTSLADSGDSDAKAIDRGLKSYFFSIVKPVVEALFNVKVSFKTQDLSQIGPAQDLMKTFELTPDQTFLSDDEKTNLVRGLLGLGDKVKGQ